MKLPVAQLRRPKDPKSGRVYSSPENYLIYDTRTGDEELMTAKEIRDSHPPIGGFGISGNTTRLKSFWTNLVYIGEEPEDPNVKYYVALRRIIKSNSIEYVLRKGNGKTLRLEEEKLIELIKAGHQAAGVRLVNTVLKKSGDVEDVYEKDKL